MIVLVELQRAFPWYRPAGFIDAREYSQEVPAVG
jgi:hypothetical protein